VLDTGIDLGHEDFEDRAEFGYDATASHMKYYNAVDQSRAHGTHVASIAARAKFGVAKNARLIDVKVLREPEDAFGLNNFKMVSEGLQWAFDDIVRHKRVGQAVINLSLGAREIGLSCNLVRSLITEVLDAGIHVVISAGNDDIAADTYCPANVQKAMTVGAVDVDYNRWVSTDREFLGSNWGHHVDIFAPGVEIEAAWAFSRSGSIYLNGTSMAAPHVSGVVASLIAYEGPRSPDCMWKRLAKLSQKEKIKNPKGGNNRFLYNGVAG
jgi:oryzin